MIPARDWNKQLAILRRNRPLILAGGGEGGWRHPWSLTARWLPQEETWGVTVKPGFVNGDEVEVTMEREHSPQATQDRTPGEQSTVRAYLTEQPTIRVAPGGMRQIGLGSSPTGVTATSATFEPVPEFFAALGVASSADLTLDPSFGMRAEADGVVGGDPENQRWLFAFDVSLVQERAATTTAWSAGAGVDGTFAQFDVAYQSDPGRRDLAYIQVGRSYTPVENLSEDPLVRLQGGWTDSGRDELHLGTVYLLSPAGVRGVPDGRWTPYYQHKLFWNLNHTTNFLPANKPDTNLKLPLPLAGGVAQLTVNQILATVNDEVDRLTEFLTTNTLTGRFWTT